MNIKIKNINEFKNKIFNIFGNEYIILSNNYKNQNSKIKVQHTKCGRIYETTARNLLRGMGCRECSYNKTKNNLKGHIYKKEIKTKEIVESDIRNAIGDDYEFIGEYKNSNTPITIKHKLCGTIYHPLLKNIITHHTGCPKCSNKSYSKGEKELLEYIKSIYSGKIDSNIRFSNHYELDIYLPDLKLGFEFNGLA